MIFLQREKEGLCGASSQSEICLIVRNGTYSQAILHFFVLSWCLQLIDL
jgi:hypothetical protein